MQFTVEFLDEFKLGSCVRGKNDNIRMHGWSNDREHLQS